MNNSSQNYYLWTIGCQMNKAESDAIGGCLESLGYSPVDNPADAEIVVMNTCVVRGSAERKVTGTLGWLKGLKRPGQALLVTGCFSGAPDPALIKRYPQVDLFFAPGDLEALRSWLGERCGRLPSLLRPTPAGAPTAYVPIIQGCDNFCAYCIVPYRRGRERSRSPEEIVAEAEALVSAGTKELTLVGQNVDSYGHDLPGQPDLASLLKKLDPLAGLARIRFLTNHPKDLSPRLIEAMATLPRVCEHINLPAQAGDDQTLLAMRRGYTSKQYRDLVERLRDRVPGIALSTDIIVGFPGESEQRFENTFHLLEDLRFHNVFVAKYSPRTGTLAARTMADDVPPEVKEERRARVEALQTTLAEQLNRSLENQVVEILVEGRKGAKWFGRTRTDKLVFFSSGDDLTGRLMDIRITSAAAWSLQGEPA
jgi:tRNA-2-methylthio-N6-dimethylallyladenosine synthase